MRFHTRTLLIALALGPPILAGAWWGWEQWRFEQERREYERSWREAYPGAPVLP
jgi:hypothetical protein